MSSEPDQVDTDEFIRLQREAEWRRLIREELDEIRDLQRKAEPHHRIRTVDVLPSVISGLTVICAVIGMLWSFMLNQNTYQASNSQKLDYLSQILADIRKNADQVPLIALQLQNMDTRQKNTEEQSKKNDAKLVEFAETLARMGVRIGVKP